MAVACDYEDNILFLKRKNKHLFYYVRNYGEQHYKRDKDIKYRFPSKYSNMVIRDVAYSSNIVYLLFENGNFIGHKFSNKCSKKTATNVTALSLILNNDQKYYSGNNSKQGTKTKSIYYSCKNGGTLFIIRNHTQCWCKKNYFGSHCQNKSNLSLRLKTAYNITYVLKHISKPYLS